MTPHPLQRPERKPEPLCRQDVVVITLALSGCFAFGALGVFGFLRATGRW